MGLRRPPDGAMGAPVWSKAGPGSPVEALDAGSRPLRPTARRQAVLCRPDGVAASVTMYSTSLPPRSLPDNKCQPVTTAFGGEAGVISSSTNLAAAGRDR